MNTLEYEVLGEQIVQKKRGYPDVQAFKRTYDAATALVEQYNRDLAAWERQVNGEKQPQQAPPE